MTTTFTTTFTRQPAPRALQRTLGATLLAAAAALAACATTATVPPELVRARSTVQQAGADPNVLSYGALELKKATDALDRANTLSAKGENLADVSSAAYVALRHAEAAQAIARSKANEDAIKASQVERERVRADASAAEADKARAEAAAAQQQADLSRMRASIARADAQEATQQARTARADAALASAQVAATTAQNEALQRQLSELQAQPTDRGMLVTLGDVLFEFGRADVKPGAQEALRRLAGWLQQHPERRVLIEGFTDSVGAAGANLQLSMRRAESVAAQLAALGIGADRLRAVGYGEGYPVAENSTDSNRAMNRRVEVYISNNDQPVRSRG
jgi:outer membrane protein OmpA-like peptidoglycan-associated protein